MQGELLEHDKQEAEQAFVERDIIEDSIVIGGIAAARTLLIEGIGDEESVKYLSYQLEGGIDELRENKNSAEYAKEFIHESIGLISDFKKNKRISDADELASHVASSISGEASGFFSEVYEQGEIDAKTIFDLLSVSSDLSNSGYVFSSLFGKRSYEYRYGNDSENVANDKRFVDVLDLAIADEESDGGSIVLLGGVLAQGINTLERDDPEAISNLDHLSKIFESFGLEAEQVGDVLAALTQNDGTKFSSLTGDRVRSALKLFTDLRSGAESSSEAKQNIRTLYKKFGIRNFHRYSTEDLATQLEKDFIPDSLVVSAFMDEGGALSAPANSAQGVEYSKPMYFEASSTLDLAKAVVTTNKTTGSAIDKILVRGHGSRDGIVLDRRNKYGKISTEQLNERDGQSGWESELVNKGYLDPEAEVIFESCSLGAGGFPQSLYERTGIKALAASDNLRGGAVKGAPTVQRFPDGSIKFGTSTPDSVYNDKGMIISSHRKDEDMTDPVKVKSRSNQYVRI